MQLKNDQICPEYDKNLPKNVENQANLTKNIQKVTAKISLKILLLVLKPTGHLVPRCRYNLQLWEDLLPLHIKFFYMICPNKKNTHPQFSADPGQEQQKRILDEKTFFCNEISSIECSSIISSALFHCSPETNKKN